VFSALQWSFGAFQFLTSIFWHDSENSVTAPVTRARVSALRHNPLRSRRVVYVPDCLQERRCSGGVPIPKMPPLEALRLRFPSPNHRALPNRHAPRPQKLARGSRSLRPRCSHSLPRYQTLSPPGLCSRSFVWSIRCNLLRSTLEQVRTGSRRLRSGLWQFSMVITVRKLVRWRRSFWWSISFCTLIFFSMPPFLLFRRRRQRLCFTREIVIM